MIWATDLNLVLLFWPFKYVSLARYFVKDLTISLYTAYMVSQYTGIYIVLCFIATLTLPLPVDQLSQSDKF